RAAWPRGLSDCVDVRPGQVAKHGHSGNEVAARGARFAGRRERGEAVDHACRVRPHCVTCVRQRTHIRTNFASLLALTPRNDLDAVRARCRHALPIAPHVTRDVRYVLRFDLSRHCLLGLDRHVLSHRPASCPSRILPTTITLHITAYAWCHVVCDLRHTVYASIYTRMSLLTRTPSSVISLCGSLRVYVSPGGRPPRLRRPPTGPHSR